MKNIKRLFPLIILGLVGGLAIETSPKFFDMVHALDTITIDAGYCSTYDNATKSELYFNMLPNDAPYNSNDWSIRYQPMANDCVTILRNGVTHNLSTNTAWDMITKCDSTKYMLETWMMGDYKPQPGDIYTIKGNFKVRDTTGNNSSLVNANYVLNISETSFIVSGNSRRTYFAALPQIVVDGGQASMPPEADQQWHFLFNLNGLEQEDAPVTGDSYGYYPTNTEDVYIDGVPVANVDKQALRRRDDWGYLFYVCSQNDIQQWDSLIKLDSLVVFDGTFIYKGNISLENNKKFGFSLNEVAFHKIGNKVNDYEVVNFREFLVNKIRNEYDVNNYNASDKVEIQTILDELDDDFLAPETVKEVYQLYNDKITVLDAFELDPEAAAQYLLGLKQAAIEELENYVDLDDYFPEQQEQVLGYINSATETINAATKKQEITECVMQTKALIDAVKVKKQVMMDAVTNQTGNYEQYLATYNRVSLNDLNIGSQTFHGEQEDRRKDLNTNNMDEDIKNTFVPLNDNNRGNVVFQFRYTPNAVPLSGANVMVNLRGMKLYGYKFAIDTSTRGCYVEVLSQDGSSWFAGSSNIFTNNQESIVEVGAIDLIEFNLTWLFLRVDGVYRFNKIVDSLGICQNPRVAICPNDNYESYNTYTGTVSLANYDSNVVVNQDVYGGILMLNEGASNSKENIYCTLDKNAIPYDSVDTNFGYPLSQETAKLTRDGATTNIANPALPLINKISETDYQLMLSEIVDVVDGDIITIQGNLSTFKDNKKTSFTISESTFTYHDSSNTWEQTINLDTYKQDAILKLQNYADFTQYDDEDVLAIEAFISEGSTAINECSSIDEVNNVLQTYKEKINQVRTTFRKYQDNAIEIVYNYKADQLNLYRQDEVNDINDLKAEAVLDIEQALTNEEIDSVVERLIYNIDRLKTDAEYTKEELEDARTEGIQKVQDHYASLNPGLLSDEERETLNNDTLQAISDIKDAETIAEIDSILQNYMSKYPLPEPKEAKNNNQTSIVLAVVIPSVAILIGLAILLVFLIRRRKKVQ